jgi:hypothetical protein
MIGRARRSHLVLLLCIAVPCWTGAFSASAASAGPLEGVTNPVSEAVGEPVREVVETVTPPVREVTEAASGPVQEVTEAPPVREVTEAATATVEGAAKEATATVAKEATAPVKAAVEAASHPSTAPKSEVAAKTEGVTRKANEDVEEVTEASQPASKNARPAGSATAGSPGATPENVPRQGSPSPSSSHVRAAAPHGAIFVPSPSKNGATAAPPPKWMSYIWPAIALIRPGLANLLDRSESMLRLVLRTTSAGSGSEGAVAGVHASGGRTGLSNSSAASSPSSSPLSKITSAVGQFPYNLSGAALGYILIVGIMLLALFVAIRWEIAHGRRDGRG